MIAIQFPADAKLGGELFRVSLPAAPVLGDRIEAVGETWTVVDRKFVMPMDREAECVVRVERPLSLEEFGYHKTEDGLIAIDPRGRSPR